MKSRISKQIILHDRIQQRIRFLRGQKVILSPDLAVLYSVPVKALVQAVKRNQTRFPEDFLFQVNREEMKNLKSQTVTSSWGGTRRALPYTFTEQCVAMLSSVLRSERAVQVNIAIMRAFVQLRSMLPTHEELRRKIEEMERKYDARFQAVFATIKQMLKTPNPVKRAIGFHAVSDCKRRKK
jgi:hypothetical protein